MTTRNKFMLGFLILLISGMIGISQVSKAHASAENKKPIHQAAVIVGPRGGVGFGRTFVGPLGGFHTFGGFFPNTFIAPRFNTFFPNAFVAPFGGFHTFGGFFPNTLIVPHWGWHF